MAGQKQRKGYARGQQTAQSAARRAPKDPSRNLLIGLIVLVAFVVVGGFAAIVLPNLWGSGEGTVAQGKGGSWVNISPDVLAGKIKAGQEFTLVNVKTPYIGEIKGTDLYIPYTDLTARASELPAEKTAPIVVYCRTGNESAIASQTLLDLGYTNIENLDGGMVAWTASGRQIIQVSR
jgi:rhodanese-related sulfurtransferase